MDGWSTYDSLTAYCNADGRLMIRLRFDLTSLKLIPSFARVPTTTNAHFLSDFCLLTPYTQ
jgi:hypothetical protein